MDIFNFNINNNPYEVKIVSIKGNLALIEVNGEEYKVDISQFEDYDIPISSGSSQPAQTALNDAKKKAVSPQIMPTALKSAEAGENAITSPMPGQIHKILVTEGAQVKAGDLVLTIEAMKMENQIKSHKDGKIEKIHFKEGDAVSEGAVLVTLGG